MKKLDRKGFTLIELLAVIVVLGVILLIAVPTVISTITDARKDSFLRSLDQYVDMVRTKAQTGTFKLQYDPAAATVVSLRVIDLDRTDGDEAVSTFGAPWVTQKTSSSAYIVINNQGTAGNPRFKYFYAAQDSDGNCIAITLEGQGAREDIKASADACAIPSITSSSTTLTIPDTSKTEANATKTVNLQSQYIYLPNDNDQ